MRLIDADALYEQTAEWEASALAYIEELNRTPLDEMDEDEKAEWRRWTAIWGERSAFKHDVADAPTIDPVRWISVTERLPGNDDWAIVTILDERGDTPWRYTDFGWYLEAANCWIVESEQRTDVTAWMPLPKPWKEKRDE